MEKNEYHYLAAVLILGKKSPKLQCYTIYHLNRKEINLEVTEVGELVNSKYTVQRRLILNEKAYLESSFISNNVAKIITYIDIANHYKVSDALFFDDDFKAYKNIWDRILEERIDKLSLLIESIRKNQKEDLPVIITEFPNIIQRLINQEG